MNAPVPRAILFDVYRTLLEVGEPPPDAGRRWHELCGSQPRPLMAASLEAVGAACAAAVGREHAAARALGIAHPEVVWPEIFCEAVPGAAALDRRALDALIFGHQALLRSVRLAAGAAEFLRAAAERGAALGIASNAQAYTLRELAEALGGSGLGMQLFDPELVVWSFELGFSKPDPHVFRVLGARLAHRGIAANETLMIGDRHDNDITPARAFGWRAWHLRDEAAVGAGDSGDWAAAKRAIFGAA